MSSPPLKKEVVHIELPEVIDERVDLAAIFGKTKPLMKMDCSKVKRINSVGIRTLMLNLARLKNEGASLGFSGLTPPMVEAMAFISNLLPKGAQIESIYIPYSCNACRHLFMVLKALDQLKKEKSVEIEHTPCVKCGQEAELDHVPELYFNWIDGLASE